MWSKHVSEGLLGQEKDTVGSSEWGLDVVHLPLSRMGHPHTAESERKKVAVGRNTWGLCSSHTPVLLLSWSPNLDKRKKGIVQSWGSLAVTLHFHFQQIHPPWCRQDIGSSRWLVATTRPPPPPAWSRPQPYLLTGAASGDTILAAF